MLDTSCKSSRKCSHSIASYHNSTAICIGNDHVCCKSPADKQLRDKAIWTTKRADKARP